MPSLVNVTFHESQFPDQVRRDLLESLRTRRINHKFHYDSVRQAHQWLALHQAYSPSRTSAECAATYDRVFAEMLAVVNPSPVHLIGLGCGGGQKDCRLLQLLVAAKRRVFYTASDVSSAMVLVAGAAAREIISAGHCSAFVCDLATTTDLPSMLEAHPLADASRLVAFFGMIPNFEPSSVLPQVRGLLRAGDYLLMSANLAPGSDYAVGVNRILPLYDNALTRDWLLTFLLDLGIDRDDGAIEFTIENDASHGLKRIEARFHFARGRNIEVFGEAFRFPAGDSIRLFFSYRHTPVLLQGLLQQHSLVIQQQWITPSEDEGIFLVNATQM